MKQLLNIKLGADPEFFLYDNIKETVISAEGLIGGTKKEPIPISDVGHCIQEDNVMAEFNIPPAIDAVSFSRDIQFVLDYVDDMVGDSISPYIKPSFELDSEYLQTTQSKLFGCEPDMNVWLRARNCKPSSKTNLRTCGGHIHVGYTDPGLESSEAIIKAMDLFLGVPSIVLDTDTRRREMYGKAGAFRFKDYGVEYRTLSNFWIETDELRQWAFNNTIAAIDFVNSGNEISVETGKRIVECINTQNVQLAEELIKEFGINLLNIKENESIKTQLYR